MSSRDEPIWLPSHDAIVVQEQALILKSVRGLALELAVPLNQVGVVSADLRGMFGRAVADANDIPMEIVEAKVVRSADRGTLPVLVVPLDFGSIVTLIGIFTPDFVSLVSVNRVDHAVLLVVDGTDNPGFSWWPASRFNERSLLT